MTENSNQSNEPTLTSEPILPRTAWNSQLTQLQVLLKAKQAIDRQENAVTGIDRK